MLHDNFTVALSDNTEEICRKCGVSSAQVLLKILLAINLNNAMGR
jgi:hypothetical protein